ncbi:MAG: hypothetical protein ACXVCQ_19175, partial [Bacteriovorax sp.]
MDKALKEKKEHSGLIIFDGEKEPSGINLIKNNWTLLGVDSNNNGVRDDVEIWANRTVKNKFLRRGFKYYAKILRLEQIANVKGDSVEALKLAYQSEKTIMCLFSIEANKEDEKIILDDFPRMWLNTNERRELDRQMDWTRTKIVNLPFESKKEYCEFD